MPDMTGLPTADELELEIQAAGFKSSEGDGRTAADIERERQQKDEEPSE